MNNEDIFLLSILGICFIGCMISFIYDTQFKECELKKYEYLNELSEKNDEYKKLIQQYVINNKILKRDYWIILTIIEKQENTNKKNNILNNIKKDI